MPNALTSTGLTLGNGTVYEIPEDSNFMVTGAQFGGGTTADYSASNNYTLPSISTREMKCAKVLLSISTFTTGSLKLPSSGTYYYRVSTGSSEFPTVHFVPLDFSSRSGEYEPTTLTGVYTLKETSGGSTIYSSSETMFASKVYLTVWYYRIS